MKRMAKVLGLGLLVAATAKATDIGLRSRAMTHGSKPRVIHKVGTVQAWALASHSVQARRALHKCGNTIFQELDATCRTRPSTKSS